MNSGLNKRRIVIVLALVASALGCSKFSSKNPASAFKVDNSSGNSAPTFRKPASESLLIENNTLLGNLSGSKDSPQALPLIDGVNLAKPNAAGFPQTGHVLPFLDHDIKFTGDHLWFESPKPVFYFIRSVTDANGQLRNPQAGDTAGAQMVWYCPTSSDGKYSGITGTCAGLTTIVDDPSYSSTKSHVEWETAEPNGGVKLRWWFGQGIVVPDAAGNGGDMGQGSINVAGDYYVMAGVGLQAQINALRQEVAQLQSLCGGGQ